MGREIRRVPPDWEHPRYTQEDASDKSQVGQLRPCYDEEYEVAARKWLDESNQWNHGEHPDQQRYDRSEYRFYWEWDGDPPKPEWYRPTFTSEPTAYQIYENVSEGTPVSPVFQTTDEMKAWLVSEHGLTAEGADAFVEDGYAVSMMVMPGRGIVEHFRIPQVLREESAKR